MSQLKELIETAKSIYGSQRALAQEIGVPETHVAMWKAGKRYCSPPDRAALAMAAGADPAAAALEAVIEGINLESPQGKRATHALQVALKRIENTGQIL